MHRDAAIAAGLSPALADDIIVHREMGALTESERALFSLATAMTNVQDAAALTTAQQAMERYFDQRQVAVFCYAIAQINAWNRLVLASENRAASQSKA